MPKIQNKIPPWEDKYKRGNKQKTYRYFMAIHGVTRIDWNKTNKN